MSLHMNTPLAVQAVVGADFPALQNAQGEWADKYKV